MLKQLFTSLSVKDVDIFLHFGSKLLDICISFPEVIVLQYLQRKAVESASTILYDDGYNSNICKNKSFYLHPPLSNILETL